VICTDVQLDYAELSAFLRAGGRLALLTTTAAGQVPGALSNLSRAGAALAGKMLRDNPNLPMPSPRTDRGGQEQNRHPITQNVTASPIIRRAHDTRI